MRSRGVAVERFRNLLIDLAHGREFWNFPVEPLPGLR